MDENSVKIKFYSLDGKTVDYFNVKKNDIIDFDKDIKTNKNFNDALKKVLKKDMKLLANKVINIVNEITKKLAINGTILNDKLESDISKIDLIISDLENIISNLIIEKNSIKIRFFSSNKKEKKEKIKKLENSIEYISKSLNDIISIKDEYNKLDKRNKDLEDLVFEDVKNDEEDETDPLERTINFYMSKNEKN